MTESIESFPLVVDHVYVWATPGAPELDAFRALGLNPYDRVTVHEGHGTASQSILFKTMYVEFVWIADPAAYAAFAATQDLIESPLEWRETGHTPFGIGLHYDPLDAPRLPLAVTRIEADWMGEGSFIEAIPQASPFVPLPFILHGPLAYTDCPDHLSTHPLGVERMTQVTITVTDLSRLDPLSAQLTAHGVVTLQTGAEPLMELTFDDQRQGATFDARPALPLVLRY